MLRLEVQQIKVQVLGRLYTDNNPLSSSAYYSSFAGLASLKKFTVSMS